MGEFQKTVIWWRCEFCKAEWAKNLKFDTRPEVCRLCGRRGWYDGVPPPCKGYGPTRTKAKIVKPVGNKKLARSGAEILKMLKGQE